MKEIVKIKDMTTPKLNNTEYAAFTDKTINLINVATVEKLGMPIDDYNAFKANNEKLTDIVKESQRQVDSSKLALLDNERDEKVVYLMQFFRTQRSSPIVAQSEAAERLYALTYPYLGIQSVAADQETAEIRGLLLDLRKPAAAADVATLGVTEVLTLLEEKNNAYAALSQERANKQMAAALGAAKPLRAEMDKQYDYLMTMAFVTSVTSPSSEASTFVAAMNKLIDDTNAKYKQRRGLAAAHQKKAENASTSTIS